MPRRKLTRFVKTDILSQVFLTGCLFMTPFLTTAATAQVEPLATDHVAVHTKKRGREWSCWKCESDTALSGYKDFRVSTLPGRQDQADNR